METQNAALLKHFKKGETITQLQASMMFGIGHLPRRILDLKEKGHDLQFEWIKVAKANGSTARVKRWRMAP